MQFQHVEPPETAGTYCHYTLIGHNGHVALDYARAGIPVFPCEASGPRRKQPRTARGHHDATTELDIIMAWWSRWPKALVGIPTGPHSSVWVLDVDGEVGRCSLNDLLPRLGLETIADVTRCVSRTPSGGLHLIFGLQPGERPRNRARDIGAGLDTRGVKADGTSAGYFIAPHAKLPEGRSYELIDATTLEPIGAPAQPFENAVHAPCGLLYLASFNATERAVIAASPELQSAIRGSATAEWPTIVDRHRAGQRVAVMAHPVQQRCGSSRPEHDRQHRYAVTILSRELQALAAMLPGSGRNDAAFRLVCRVGRWVHSGIIARDQLIADVLAVCEANGLVRDDGRKAVLATIASGLAKSAGDALPDLGAP